MPSTVQFIEHYTSGFDEISAPCEAVSWPELERQSGVPVAQIRAAAEIYRQARSAVIGWCLGLTQQEYGVDAIREIVNVLMLRGNIGREGAGPCPIRGHSNVQGNRTCGIDHRPSEAWLARLDAACGITSPRAHGLDVVRTIEGMYRGDVKFFLGMGGNFALATPDTVCTYEALRRCELTVHVSTKLNRSHLVHGREALILPCLGRTEKDRQQCGLQQVTVEDSMSMVHLSKGMNEPASPNFAPNRPSSPASPARHSPIRGRRGKSTRPTMTASATKWPRRSRASRSLTAASVSRWASACGNRPASSSSSPTRAGRNSPPRPLPDLVPPPGKLLLMTMRSHDQFNTTIYSDNDRYRGVKNLRTLLLMNEDDMRERGLDEFSLIDITSFAKDGTVRSVQGYRAVRYEIPRGNTAGYMPELNVLCPIGDYSVQSDQPLMKHLVVEVTPSVVPEAKVLVAQQKS